MTDRAEQRPRRRRGDGLITAVYRIDNRFTGDAVALGFVTKDAEWLMRQTADDAGFLQ